MGCKTGTVVSGICIGLLAVAVILVIAGVAVDRWYYYESAILGVTTKSYGGLWRSCAKVADNSEVCVKHDDDALDLEINQYIIETRGLSITGLVLTFIACVCAIVHLAVKPHLAVRPDLDALFFVEGIISLIAGIFLVAAWANYYENYIDTAGGKKEHLNDAAGFILVCFSSFLVLAAGIVYVILGAFSFCFK